MSFTPLPGSACGAQPPWWRGATIYQVYIRSFQDSDGDGIGDLPGVIDRLDYIAGLGVDAIWLSPFFKSPMADFGYDISDYRDVDPQFGTLEDFDRLLREAHARGLRVLIDQVLSHTSDQHAWFKESRADRTNAKADWYVWADPKDDGTPPNNWLSIFGGSAWKWEPRRHQYYLHNFLAEQPDLNFHNRAVRAAVLDNVRFWLERGVDGLRLDAINFCFHDAALRDNPPKSAAQRDGRGFSPDNPYAYQFHYFDNTQPQNLLFLEELGALLARYGDVVSLGELQSEDTIATMADYTAPGRLHMAYSFALLGDACSAAYLRATVEETCARMPQGWPCWAISNHDVRRVVSRWGGETPSPSLALLFTALLCSLKGSACIFQGEELGLGEADIPFESLRDPYGIEFWPDFKGRDGCRTPMPWTSAEDGGFTTGKPWLPIWPAHRNLAVSEQDGQANSALNAFRRFLAWRKQFAVLRDGDIRFIAASDSVLAFTREGQGMRMLIAFNLAERAVALEIGSDYCGKVLTGHGFAGATLSAGKLSLPPLGAIFLLLDN